MGTYSGNLAPSGPYYYSQSSTAYLYTTTDWQFIVNRVSAKSLLSEQQLEDGADSYINLIVTTSNGSSISQKIDMTTTDRQYYNANLSISVPAYNWVHLDAQYVNANVYWNHSNTLIAGGWTGSNITPSQIGFFDIDFTINYVDIWDIDSQNDGYARIAAYDVEEFTGFAKDDFGYPTNWGVWKLDDNNDGYPWMTGYEDFIVKGLPVKIMSQDKTHWVNVGVGVFTTEKILNAYINLIKGDDANANNENAVDSE